MAQGLPARAIVIGGTGGSGTRVLAEACRANGMVMPRPRNSAHDWLGLRRIFNVWLRQILAHTGSLDYRFADLPAAIQTGIEADLVAAFAGDAIPPAVAERGRPFGWKNPRSLMLLPVLAHFIPDLAVVQLVRDGRDMALSKNDNQSHRYGKFLFDDPDAGGEGVAAARFWSRANVEALQAGRAILGERHHVLRFEDACADAGTHLPPLLTAVGLRHKEIEGLFVTPESLGRWRTLPADEAAAVEAVARPGLEAFGYL